MRQALYFLAPPHFFTPNFFLFPYAKKITTPQDSVYSLSFGFDLSTSVLVKGFVTLGIYSTLNTFFVTTRFRHYTVVTIVVT